VPVSAALLKGRPTTSATTTCGGAAGGAAGEPPGVDHLQRIARFARSSNSGDKGELAEVPGELRRLGGGDLHRDNCLGQECPDLKECFVMRARREALAAASWW